jgi:hypothetical protein
MRRRNKPNTRGLGEAVQVMPPAVDPSPQPEEVPLRSAEPIDIAPQDNESVSTALASPPPVTRVTSMTNPPIDIWIIDQMQSVCRGIGPPTWQRMLVAGAPPRISPDVSPNLPEMPANIARPTG